MKKFIAISLAFLAFNSQAAIFKSYDPANDCTLYRSVDLEKVKLDPSKESLIYSKSTYGLSLENMDVNFETREVHAVVMINIVLGFNRPLVNKKSIIPANHPDFHFLINQLNRKIQIFEKVCLNYNNEIVFAKLVPVSDSK